MLKRLPQIRPHARHGDSEGLPVPQRDDESCRRFVDEATAEAASKPTRTFSRTDNSSELWRVRATPDAGILLRPAVRHIHTIDSYRTSENGLQTDDGIGERRLSSSVRTDEGLRLLGRTESVILPERL